MRRLLLLLAVAACTDPKPVKRPLCPRRVGGLIKWQNGRIDTFWIYTPNVTCRLPGDSL